MKGRRWEVEILDARLRLVVSDPGKPRLVLRGDLVVLTPDLNQPAESVRRLVAERAELVGRLRVTVR